MAFDEKLADRVRGALGARNDVTEKKMFGGLCFMVSGRMCVGIVGDELMVRIGPEAHAAGLQRPHARPMDFSGRPMVGFLYVGAAGITTKATLQRWVEESAAYAMTQEPAKKKRKKASK